MDGIRRIPHRAFPAVAGVALLLVGCTSTDVRLAAAPAVHRCRRVAAAPRIDGHIEDCWRHADVIDRFVVPGTGEPAQSRTVARLLWDDRNLYICYEASDLDVWGYLREHDASTCLEDVLEAFLMPGDGSEQYVNFEINALGTVYDAHVQHVGFPMALRWQAWDCQGLQVAVRVRGTLNDGSDQDQGWTMEVAIPFASLPFCKRGAPVPGEEWLFHLARYDYSLYLPTGRELSSCAPLSRPAFHNAAEWLRLRFE